MGGRDGWWGWVVGMDCRDGLWGWIVGMDGGDGWRGWMEGMRETGSEVGGDCDFLLERAYGSGIVLFKMGVPGGSNLTLPGTAEWNRRSSIH